MFGISEIEISVRPRHLVAVTSMFSNHFLVIGGFAQFNYLFSTLFYDVTRR